MYDCDCLMSFRNGGRPEIAESAAFANMQARTDAVAATPSAALGAVPVGKYSNREGLGPLSDPTAYDFDLFQFTPGVDLSDMFVFDDAGYSTSP